MREPNVLRLYFDRFQIDTVFASLFPLNPLLPFPFEPQILFNTKYLHYINQKKRQFPFSAFFLEFLQL